MPKLKINDIEIEVAPGTSLLQACEQLGIEVPRFCYHDRLSVPANCRMCLVELKGAPKPMASCALAAGENMEVYTESEMVKKARKGVLEMLLINHPLDCPICDQGGECDLQDEAFAYGFDRSRFKENKRAVTDKDLGPLVKTIMTRCIHCTRCVRFLEEVAGTPELGQVYRGEEAEISTFVPGPLTSELQGNIIDICPVGALTSKPYAFNARPWELRKTPSVDVMDAVGSNIRIDCRGREVMRILPRLHEGINEEWISDKTRFVYDGLKKRRLDRPYLKKQGKLQPVSWEEALSAAAAKLTATKPQKIAALAGDLCDAEAMKALKDLMQGLGTPHLDCRQDGAQINPKNRGAYLFNSTIAGIEQADVILLVGCDPRDEAVMVNARLRKRYLQGGVKIGLIGEQRDLTYPYKYLGAGAQSLRELATGQHDFCKILQQAKKPLMILGMGVLQRPDGAALHQLSGQVADQYLMREGWNGFNLLHLAAARVAGLDMGFVPGEEGKDTAAILQAAEKGEIEVLYLLGADEIPTKALQKPFVIYQGHHGDVGAHAADIILPGCAYTEKTALYTNMEGRVQQILKANDPPGDAREDWRILRALSEAMEQPLPYDDQLALRTALAQDFAGFAHIAEITPSDWQPVAASEKVSIDDQQPFGRALDGFFLSNAICRASDNMAACVAEILPAKEGQAATCPATGTEG